MVLECLPDGMFGSNSYIVGDKGECAVVDAGVDSGDIIKAAEKLGLEIKYILLTHGHIDHICSVDRLRKATGAKALINAGDAEALTDPEKNGSGLFGYSQAFNPADGKLADGDILEVGGLSLQILHTPGHSQGCVCIKVGEVLFTGDTLFRRSIGRTDLSGGNFPQIIKSIKEKLMVLDESTVVYPGHGETSTIGYEKKNNPFIK